MPNWTKEQSLAIDKDGLNIIVSAGAGSGKTAVLTARVIRKLKDGVPVDKLLVLTFTNEAAGEMKDRIRKAIKKEVSLKDKLDLIDSAYITTFDSFALSVLRNYNYALGVSKNISIIDSSIIDIKKSEAIDEIFNFLYEQKDKDFLKLIEDFCVKDDADIKEKVLKISNSLDMRLDKREFLDNYIVTFFDNVDFFTSEYINKIIELKDEIKCLYNDLISSSSDKDISLYECLLKLINSDSYNDIKNSLDISLPKKVEDKELKEKIKNLIDELKERVIYENESSIKDSYLSTKVYIQAIIKIINMLDDKINTYKEANDNYEFIDVAKMAIKIVKENPDIRDEIKYFYNEIMVDEYQDTNDLQESFISYISNNNVYMVGDVKQSIYRFRNANPMIFKDKYDNYSIGNGGFKIDLTKNFRSREEVLSDINKIFDKIMDEFLGGANYRESHRMVFGNNTYLEQNDNTISNYMEIYNYSDKETSFSKEEIEAFIIAKDIKEKIDNKYLVLDKDTNKLRPITYDDFCIIMDRGTSFDLYKKIFEYYGIPLVIYRDEILTSSYDISIIKNAIKFIIKIKNKEYDKEFRYLFISLARSYLFEFSDKDIFDIFESNNFYDNNIYKIAKNIAKNIDDISTSGFLNRVVDNFDFYRKIIKVNDIEGILIRILYLKKITKSLEDLGYTPYDLANYLDEMTSGDYEIKYKLNNKITDSVKIMNIHKSKGLEFPICYYSGLYKKFNIRDFNDRFMYDNKYGIITPYYSDGIGSIMTKILAKDNYIQEEISEKIRLLYVALTRSKEKMIFIAPLEDKNLDRLKYRSFLDIVNSIQDNFDVRNINDLSFVTKDYQKYKDVDLDKIKEEGSISIKDIKIDYEEKKKNKFSKVTTKLLSKEQLINMEKGTSVHYIFETEDFLNPSNELVKKFLSHKEFKNIKNSRIYKEYEFVYESDNSTSHGIIDLMLVYEDHIDIIDYKLSNTYDKNYIKQLNGYKNYIEKKSCLPVNTYLYSIEKDELRLVLSSFICC